MAVKTRLERLERQKGLAKEYTSYAREIDDLDVETMCEAQNILKAMAQNAESRSTLDPRKRSPIVYPDPVTPEQIESMWKAVREVQNEQKQDSC